MIKLTVTSLASLKWHKQHWYQMDIFINELTCLLGSIFKCNKKKVKPLNVSPLLHIYMHCYICLKDSTKSWVYFIKKVMRIRNGITLNSPFHCIIINGIVKQWVNYW